jgi:hypothetical protein
MNTLTTITARKAYLRSRAANLSNANWRALGEYKNTLNYRARAARAAPAAATVNRNTLGRVIHRGPRGGEYVVGPGGRKIRTFTRATAAAPAPAAAPTAAETRAAEAIARKLSAYLKLGNNEYVNKYGILYNSQAKTKIGLAHRVYNNARVRAFNKDPKFLKKHSIPYVSYGRPNQALKSKLKLKNSTIGIMGKTYNGQNIGVTKKVYFNRRGDLYFISLNGKKHALNDYMTQSYFGIRDPKDLRRYKRIIGRMVPNYPRSAIPPNTPAPRRSSPELMNNIITQIFEGGRGSTINAGRYTAAERNVLANRLANTVAHFRHLRNAKKAEAAQHRENIRAPGLSNNMKRIYRNRAAAANERVGYYNNAVRSYTRGLRAVKPLSGVVTPRARAMPNTPNRYTPAPASVEENAIYMPLNRPHLVVKTPGVGTIYLNPNTFTGLVKNAARVNIAPANIRNWLRMARRNFPNEALFRHPLAPKNVTASHIRFSRG